MRALDVRVDLDANLPPIRADPSMLQEVLTNLMTNSLQALHDSGRIAVSTAVAPRLPLATAKARVAIRVSDNGPGIAPADLRRLFEPFFTTKDVGVGTGLGLAMAYKIVADHGGEIDVLSKPGQGATFTVFLPIETDGYTDA
jgi:signal transduction histidine kinase